MFPPKLFDMRSIFSFKHHSEGENVPGTRYPPYKEKAVMVQKYSEKATSPKKHKINKNTKWRKQLLRNCVWLSGACISKEERLTQGAAEDSMKT